ncbi:sensor histidine kinase [Polyangium mundeleinium]|uniref:histidine kinase n=1 Tax=Polyangium mundeleinium TaxID=2995306 RepID=A0ABT5F3Z5_9BACT|nr:ATP-binding protein [Polyangium mundeleinium]MDC0748726.1 ATP-binding protein [Polyangium mundeleinium]
MTLAARLLLAFGLVAIFAAALVGLSLRDASRQIIESDFEDRIEAAAVGVRRELAREARALEGLLGPLCAHDTFVDKAHLLLERARGDEAAIESDARISMRHFVPDQARALGLDDLVLVTDKGLILAASDVARTGTKAPDLAKLLRSPTGGAPRLRPDPKGGEASLEVHCARSGGGVEVGLVGARRVGKILERIGASHGVELRVEGPERVKMVGDAVVRPIDVAEVPGLRVVAIATRDKLHGALAKLDRAMLFAGSVALVLGLAIAFVLARSLSRPLVELARETREVVAGAPRTVKGRGGRELTDLADAWNRTIAELAAIRRRLAATERIAAQREVARQIAHEIKNPLAPIRAAVETLRRLRAREDPAFDEYFEEATVTVLQEVHRIANIVTEFTRFARLPPPNPEPIDLVSVVKGVVTLHASAGEGVERTGTRRVELSSEPIPKVMADRDQMVQVLTNLIQNGLDAASAVRPDPRVLVTIGPLSENKVRIVVRDNGPGVPAEMVPRLFEAYATTKEKGTGLGLAIVQRIVFEHGGEIAYREAKKGGAVFEVWLPVSGPPLLDKPPAVETTLRGPDKAA